MTKPHKWANEMTRLIDADALKVNWYTEKTNRDEPVWEFNYCGHHGVVVFGGDTMWSAKLDNSGKYGICSSTEAKLAVEQWLRAKITRNIKTAKEYIARYADLINNASIPYDNYLYKPCDLHDQYIGVRRTTKCLDDAIAVKRLRTYLKQKIGLRIRHILQKLHGKHRKNTKPSA